MLLHKKLLINILCYRYAGNLTRLDCVYWGVTAI